MAYADLTNLSDEQLVHRELALERDLVSAMAGVDGGSQSAGSPSDHDDLLLFLGRLQGEGLFLSCPGVDDTTRSIEFRSHDVYAALTEMAAIDFLCTTGL